jgi:catalase
MDAEMVRKLAGLLPVTNDFTINFTPKCFDEIDQDFRPVFTLKPFTQKEVKEIAAKMANKVDQDFIMEQVKTKIVSWSNLINISTQEDVQFDVNIIDTFPTKIINELTSELLRISGLS